MSFELRDYQKEAVEAGLSSDNGILCLSTGAGKSLVARGLVEDYHSRNEKVIILQPSAEILKSNIAKAHDAGIQATAYSSGYGEKNISDIMYATIKSVVTNQSEFKKAKDGKKKFQYIPHDFMQEFKGCRLIVDECHTVNPAEGQYIDLINYLNPKSTIGMTATPYRAYRNSMGTTMRIQTRTRPKLFKDILYTKSTSSLLDDGWLHDPEMIKISTNEEMLVINSAGSDYTKKSLKLYEDENDIVSMIVDIVKQVEGDHNHLLVFTPSVATSQEVVSRLTDLGISADEISANSKKRQQRTELFEKGETKVLLNYGTFTTGYDFPALDCIVDARPVLSASLHYQKIGRIVRPFEGKKGVVYDVAGNLNRLSNPLRYKLLRNHRGLHELYSPDGRMTSIPISEEPEWMTQMPFGKYKDEEIRMLPTGYIKWFLENNNSGPNTPALDALFSEHVMRNWDSF